MSEIAKTEKKRTVNQRKMRERLFLLSVWIYPAALFLVLYVYINFNSVLLAFKTYDARTYEYIFSGGFKNFAEFFDDIFHKSALKYAFRNSAMLTVVQYFLSLPLAIIISFFLYKKIFLAETFKVIFFIPAIIPGIVWVTLYKYMLEYGIPAILKGIPDPRLLSNPDIAFYTLMTLNFWVGIGSTNLIYLGTMSRVPESLIESGKLDGMTMFQELWHITIPLVFPIITISLITIVYSLFLADPGIYAYYGSDANFKLFTLNYYLFVQVIGKNATPDKYPYAAAGGLIFTVIVAPLTMLIRYLLEKFGPATEY